MRRSAITPALVARLVAAQFPEWAHLPIRPVELDGWDNRTFRLGETMSVRLPSADAYAVQVEKEQRWLPVLAPELPLAIPTPLGRGVPGEGFPRPWSVYRWLDGDVATPERIVDLERFAADLAGFVVALHRIDATGGPAAGEHSFFRGGPLAAYEAQTRVAITILAERLDVRRATEVWADALETTWRAPPVWVHGDLTPANLLVRGGRLGAVIDLGCCAVGDPACDLAIAWTCFEGASRARFRARLEVDGGTWRRGRGWALWKALVTLAASGDDGLAASLRFGWRASALGVAQDVLADLG